MREIKYKAFIRELKWTLDVAAIDFRLEMVEVYTPGDDGGTAIYSFDDVELREFTGLLDKNGKEIYEGDIVLNEDNHSCEV